MFYNRQLAHFTMLSEFSTLVSNSVEGKSQNILFLTFSVSPEESGHSLMLVDEAECEDRAARASFYVL